MLTITYQRHGETQTFTVREKKHQKLDLDAQEAYYMLMELVINNEGYDLYDILDDSLYAADSKEQGLSNALFELGIDEFSIMCERNK